MASETIGDWLEAVAREHADNTAVTFLRDGRNETEVTFGQLQADVNRFANFLLDLGVKKGDRVILFIRKSLVAVTAHFALHRIGAMAVPLNPGFKKSELEYLLGDASAGLIITEPDKVSLLREIDSRAKLLEVATGLAYQDIDFFRAASDSAPGIGIAPGDPGLIVYTSGTTGNPKGTMLTHANLVHDARNVIDIWEFSANDVLCHALPLFHVHGLCFAMHTALLSGSHVRMLDQFHPDTVIAELSRNTGGAVCSVFMAVPAMYTQLMDIIGKKYLDFSHMRLFTSGSAPLPVKEFERITSVFGQEPVEREGMTETGMNFSNPLSGPRIPGSIGLPLPGVEVRIVDPNRFSDVAAGEVGELWLKSSAITPGYWGKPEETAETFKDGWFRIGDLGKMDDAGYYYLTDRIKHIIISGGENVLAKEVETVINQIDGIDESVVVGKPDEKWGEKVVAAVTLKPDAEVSEADIKAYCKEHLHDWKCPKEIMFLDIIPRNTMGKILKEEVKKLF
ncbi:Long-chain-fatty-acid--CoA ligase (EC [Olavius algarvensis associated proteobacterium Delta 3]|nr:Long-chain-fatty-acid--CoA ligase (EC [Olavius algarvensis associated proteobacterium Delta 3]